MIDPDGYRPNVAIVLMNDERRVFWAKRASNDGWQFPQGGMRTDETPVEAMYRELEEETGLQPDLVELIGSTPGWLRYRLPRRYQRQNSKPLCIGNETVLPDGIVITANRCASDKSRSGSCCDSWATIPLSGSITVRSRSSPRTGG